MSAVATHARDAVRIIRLSCVDWNTYSRLLRDFAEQRSIRLTYDCGELEIMARSSFYEDNECGDGCIRLSCVDWKTYSRLIRDFEEHPNVRLTFDHGELEIMSPLLQHEDDSRFLGELVVELTRTLRLPRRQGGSTTLRRTLRQQGVEPDDCFWIANAHRMKGRRRLDLSRDPPPDLAIEVDVTRRSINRFPIYAALRVPELWQLPGNVLVFHVLGADGEYAKATHGFSFPLVKPADLMKFVRRARKAGDWEPVMEDFRVWIRQRLAKQP